MTTTSPTSAATNDRFRHTIIGLLAALAIVSVVLVASTGPASAHDGHGATNEVTAAPNDLKTTNTATTVRTNTTTALVETRNSDTKAMTTRSAQIAKRAIESFHLAKTDDVTIGRNIDLDGLELVGNGGGTAGANADCFVDFDDDLVLQYHIPGGAENTFMTSHWYQKCFSSSYPAVAVKYMNHGHFHLGYQDPRVGPCEGNQTDWGRKAEPAPTDTDDLGAWVIAPCVSDIDPVTEPRSHISAHLPGHKGKIVAYDGDGYLPFQLRSFEVVSGEVEVCHLPAGPIVVANGGGSPWQCTTLDQGHWNLSNHVPSAIEVRFEFLTNGAVDNIAVDLL